MKVVHISPTYFDEGSIIGGGERYPSELALWMSKYIDTTLVSFSTKRQSYRQENLKIEIYPARYLFQNNKLNSFNLKYITQIVTADIVHIHTINSPASALGALIGDIFKKKIFVTDHGGGTGLGWKINQIFSISPRYQNAISNSAFGLNHLPKDLQFKRVSIKGGIDTTRFHISKNIPKEKTILYVGRLLPHKGIDYLIRAFKIFNCPEYGLKIIGRIYYQQYYDGLLNLAKDLSVEFIHDADDQQLLREYQTAMVTVLPSVHTTCYGDYTPVPELMGFTLLESQACGTPVICTDAGAMHEFVDTGKTGLVVKQNSPEAIALGLKQLVDIYSENPQQLEINCLEWVRQFNWESVVQQHLELYQR